jgi:hypothetical protein
VDDELGELAQVVEQSIEETFAWRAPILLFFVRRASEARQWANRI